MNEELKAKYVPPSFSSRLIDNWCQYTQGNKSVKKYVEKFYKLVIRCSTLHKKREVHILSRFRAGLRDDLRTELLVRRVNELKVTYTIVQDLDSLRYNYNTKNFDSKSNVSRTSSFF